ncbi:MAG: hypothetical protein NUW01_14320 [Gemmatimonadaceae bacterium]|nr:hypothetical protein [Gemmatimonadaceae bacterium]
MSTHYLTLAEAAQQAGVSLPALRKAMNRGKVRTILRTIPTGQTYHVTTLAWVKQYLEQRPAWAKERA